MARREKRPRLEVADILRAHGEEYRRLRTPSARARQVLRNIEQCRTRALGGHKDTCQSCGHVRFSYNSCRDRHCPKCQSLKKDEWLERRKERLLPIPYFHVVFTIPEELNPLAIRNKRFIYGLLFDTAAKTLQKIARDPQHLGAECGFTAILHTWGQTLQFHPHIHCVVSGGGLSEKKDRWIPARQSFFLPVRVLADLFRGKFLDALKAERKAGRLDLSGSAASLVEPRSWQRFLNNLYRLRWVVHAKPPFGGPEHVFRYLARYTHRVAISNHRLLALEDGKVTFRYKDYADYRRKKKLTISAVEFIRRFLLHVLPLGFVRIRHYGLLASRNVETKLARARALLEPEAPVKDSPAESSESPLTWWERLLELTGVDIFACPACREGRMHREPLLPERTERCLVFDTS